MGIAAPSVGLGCGCAVVEEQEAVVAGEDETAHAGVAQECPRRPQLLHNGVEDGGAELVFTRFVDLAAVDDDEPGLGN